MKKLISIVVALALSQAALIRPLYAEELDPTATEETTTQVITIVTEPPEVVTLPNAAAVVPETLPAETTAGLGVIETPRGAGTVLEDVGDNEVSRQFITVQSRGGNVFYIIIENDRDRENVYFLNAVDDFDLLSFSENFPDGVWEAYEELKEEAAANAIAAEIEGNAEGEDGGGVSAQNTKNTTETPTGGNSQIIILVVVGLGFAGGFAYFKFFRGKKKAVSKPHFDDEDDDEEEENEEEQEDE